jgi:hypothetical protein
MKFLFFLLAFVRFASSCCDNNNTNITNIQDEVIHVTKYIYKYMNESLPTQYNSLISTTTTTPTTTSTTTTATTSTIPTTTTPTTTTPTTTTPTTSTPTTSTTPTTTTTTTTQVPIPTGGIRISSGNRATLTYFTDTSLQCGSYSSGQLIAAVNPKLLGVTDEEWLTLYANASPENIPWCNKQLKVVIDSVEYIYTIGDTCDPVGPTPQTPFAGGKCDYDDVIDLWNGRDFLVSKFGDDFYQGNIEWELLD